MELENKNIEKLTSEVLQKLPIKTNNKQQGYKDILKENRIRGA